MQGCRSANWGPPEAMAAYRGQLSMARKRHIAWLFTPKEWWAWWQVDDRWKNRGRRRGNFVMARIGDSGPYSVGNVYCTTPLGNSKDVPFEVRRTAGIMSAVTKGDRCAIHLRVRGDGHPRSKAVITPKGRFGSAALAADAHGYTRQHAARLARLGKDGWSQA